MLIATTKAENDHLDEKLWQAKMWIQKNPFAFAMWLKRQRHFHRRTAKIYRFPYDSNRGKSETYAN